MNLPVDRKTLTKYELYEVYKLKYPNGKECRLCKNELPVGRYKIYSGNIHSRCIECEKSIRKTPEYKNNKNTLRNSLRRKDVRPSMLEAAKRRATKRGLEFSLTIDDIVVPKYCPILGIKLEVGSENRDNWPSLDRIDNNIGYLPINIQVISNRANAIKRDATVRELELLVSYLKNKTS